MGLELNRFTSEMMYDNQLTGTGGIAKSSHFEVRIGFPSNLTNEPRAMEVLTLRCDSMSFPSRAVLTSNIKYFGPETRRAYGYDAAPVTATFILSQNLAERDLFLSWQDLTIGNARQNVGGAGTAKTFLVGYYKSYVAPIEIIKYNDTGIRTMTTTLVDAYPSFIGEVGTDWSSDEILKVNVTFNYRYFTDDIRGGFPTIDPRLAALFQSALNGSFADEARESGSELVNTGIRSFF